MYDVLALAHHLRSIGVPVSATEISDTYRALALAGPDHARRVPAMTLVKRADHRRALSGVLDLFLADGSGDADGVRSLGSSGPPRLLDDLDEDELHAFTLNALRLDDTHGVAAAAAALVKRHVIIRPGAPVAGTVHVMRAYRAARPHRLLEAMRADAETDPTDPLDRLRVRSWARQTQRRVETLRQAIETEVRRRLVRDRGSASVAAAISSSLPEDTDFLTASSGEIDALTTVLDSLPSRLEQHLQRTDARPADGRLDARATMRRAMAYGGTPAAPIFHPRRPPQPELLVLADISGSVASFARFTLSLSHSLHRRFRSVRSFVFIDGLDEVTDLMSDVTDLRETAARIDRESLGVHLDGHSDYGRVLADFDQRHGRALGARSVVLVLGDARSNYLDPRTDALRAITRRAGRVYWLNPERRATWTDGDSVIATYAPHCTGVHECRTVRQLEDFVLRHIN